MKNYGEVYFDEYPNEFDKETMEYFNIKGVDLSKNIFGNKYCEGVEIDFNGSVYIVPDKVNEFRLRLANLVGEFQKEFGI